MKCLISLTALGVVALAAAASAAADTRPPGKVVFDRWCGGCHMPLPPGPPFRPPGIPIMPQPAGTLVLGERYGNTKPAALEERTDLPPEFIKVLVRSGMGFMPPLRKTEISDAQLEQLAAYLSRTAGGSR